MKSLIGTCIGVALALTLLGYRYIGKHTDFGDAAALGAQTSSLFASSGDYPIHCQPEGMEDCLRGIEARKRARHFIWFGNSQLHAINQYEVGELTAPAILSGKLAQNGIDVITISHANANLQEQYVIFEYLRTRVRFNRLILPVVFDDFREEGLTDGVVALLRGKAVKPKLAREEPGGRLLEERLAQEESGGRLLEEYLAQKADHESGTTPQEYVENRLDKVLQNNLPLWAARAEMRGDIFVDLYRLRNMVFGITQNTKRKMIMSRYVKNMAALQSLLKTASEAGIRVFVYVAPVNIDNGERPYVEAEYARFKGEVEALATRYGATFDNLEDLIPGALWGRKDSTAVGATAETDFMHFTAAGHTVFAERILNEMQAMDGKRRQ